MSTHPEHAKKAGIATPCTAHHVNFGGGCLNCGWLPESTMSRHEKVSQSQMRHAALSQAVERAARSGEPCTVYVRQEQREWDPEPVPYWYVRADSEGPPEGPACWIEWKETPR